MCTNLNRNTRHNLQWQWSFWIHSIFIGVNETKGFVLCQTETTDAFCFQCFAQIIVDGCHFDCDHNLFVCVFSMIWNTITDVIYTKLNCTARSTHNFQLLWWWFKYNEWSLRCTSERLSFTRLSFPSANDMFNARITYRFSTSKCVPTVRGEWCGMWKMLLEFRIGGATNRAMLSLVNGGTLVIVRCF